MMTFDILTLFPELVESVLSSSIIGRAQEAGYIQIKAHQIREYSKDPHHNVDDTPAGGGMGMLMSPQPIYDCAKAVYSQYNEEQVHTIYMSPKGSRFTQAKAKELLAYPHIVILCGHYEGIDERVLDELVDEELSIGDYVLTGGELPACIVCDAVARMVDGVLADPICYEEESIASGLLEYPQYTRPTEWHGKPIPSILLSGDHTKIEEWRHIRSISITKEKRPDLYESYIKKHPITPRKQKRKRSGGYVLRYIEERDHQEIEEIIRSCLIEFGANREGFAWSDPELSHLSTAYQEPHTAYFVVEDETGALVGGAGIGPYDLDSGVCELQKMYTKKEVRGKGVGGILMQACLSFAKKHYLKCYLETLGTMVAANHFYVKWGFQKLDAPLKPSIHFSCDTWYIREV